jgi:hypothetical protein
MTDKATWLALAARCEEAKGPDREIDFDIDAGLAAPALIRGFIAKMYYTASIDAITALIERELPGAYVHSLCDEGNYAAAGVNDCGAHALTEPLARCVAFCRAKAKTAYD